MINKYWRILATGSAFFLFGFGGIFLSIIIFPLLNVFYRNTPEKRRKIARKIVHKTFKMFIGYMQLTGIMKLEINNAHLLQNAKGKLVVANHPSLIDVVVLVSIIENADCVVKADLFKNPFLKGVVLNTGYINNAEDPEIFIADCKKSFAQGNNLVVFPEGTRTTENKPINFRRGAANIALRAEVDLLPILLFVSPTTLTKELAWYQIPERRFTFTLDVKEPISVQKHLANNHVSNSVRELTRELTEYYYKELNVHERIN